MPHTPSSPADTRFADPSRDEVAGALGERRHGLVAQDTSVPAEEADRAGTASRWPRYAAGAAIGSAAIAAALLYYNRKGAD